MCYNDDMIIIKQTQRCKKEGCFNRSMKIHFSNGNKNCDSCREKHRNYYKKYVGRYAKRLSQNYFKNHDKYRKKHRFHHLLKKYNITEDKYNKMFSNQNGKCGICELSFGSRKEFRDACIDHDHATGKVRGLLCRKCNLALGIVEDKIFFEKAQLYLKSMKVKIKSLTK